MPIEKLSWNELSGALRREIEKRTGPIRRVETVKEGLNSGLSLRVWHGDSEMTFIKGLPLDHPRRRTQDRERAINPSIHSLSARLRWSLTAHGWDLSAFEYVPGRRVDYSPGSPDLPLVVELLCQLTTIDCPELDIKRAEDRWSSYTDQSGLFAGEQLSHTEWSPGNVLIGDRARLVDWAWVTRAAAWIDPACWVVWLVASGHSPSQAEKWAAQVPSWHIASPFAITEFARVQTTLWTEIAEADPMPWIQGLAIAAKNWLAYRQSTYPFPYR